jgi:hypothetical protein
MAADENKEQRKIEINERKTCWKNSKKFQLKKLQRKNKKDAVK